MNNPKARLLLLVCLVTAVGALLASFGAGSHFQFGFTNGDFNFDVRVAFGESKAAIILGAIALTAGLVAIGLALARGGQTGTGEAFAPGTAGASGISDFIAVLRRLTKSKKDQWLGGVCGGLGEHTPLPSWVWRLLFLGLLICYGTGVLLYVLLWICLPQPSPDEDKSGTAPEAAK
jgi:phage shock protein C